MTILEKGFIPFERWDSCGAPPEALKIAREQTALGVPTSITFDPNLGWVVLQTSGQGPYVIWPRIFGTRMPIEEAVRRVSARDRDASLLRPALYSRRSVKGEYFEECWVLVNFAGKIVERLRTDRAGRTHLGVAPGALYVLDERGKVMVESESLDPNRRAGRTTHALKNAVQVAAAGREVTFVVSTLKWCSTLIRIVLHEPIFEEYRPLIKDTNAVEIRWINGGRIRFVSLEQEIRGARGISTVKIPDHLAFEDAVETIRELNERLERSRSSEEELLEKLRKAQVRESSLSDQIQRLAHRSEE